MAVANREVVVHIIITEDEARYLKTLLRNPISYDSPELEPTNESVMRSNIFNVLREVFP